MMFEILASLGRLKTVYGTVCFLVVFGFSNGAFAQSEETKISEEISERPYENEMEALIDFQRAKEMVQSGDFIKALPLLQKIVKVAPRSSVRFYLGRAYAGLGRCEEALAELLDLEDTIPKEVATKRDEEVRRCLRYGLEHAIAERDCQVATRLLSGLNKLISEAELTWRQESVNKCYESGEEAQLSKNSTDSSPDDLSQEQEVWGWSMMSAFVVFGGVSLYYGVWHGASVDKMEEYQDLYNSLDGSSKLGLQGQTFIDRARDAQGNATVNGAVAWGSAGLAAVSLGLGLYFLLSEPWEEGDNHEQNTQLDEKLSVVPLISPSSIGVFTRF